MNSRWANVLTAAGLIALLAALSLTAPLWSRLLRRPVAGEEEAGASPGAPASPLASAEAQRTIKVKLYFEGVEHPGLVPEEREVAYSDDVSRQLRAVVEALVAGSGAGLKSPLPPAARVLDVFVTPQGTAYVDFSSEIRQAAPPSPTASPAAAPSALPVTPPSPISSSSQAELVAVYAVVDTLAVNFPAVKRVQLLVDGVPMRSLWGHVDLARPLAPDLSLLAGVPTAPGGGPWRDPALATPAPAPAPSPAP